MNQKERRRFDRMMQMLGKARFWMGELHGYYWHRNIHKLSLGKSLIRDIKKMERLLEK